jgi:polyketide synthase PksN
MADVSQNELIIFLQQQVAEFIKANPSEIDPDTEFINFGIDSMNAIYIIEVLEKKLNAEINPLHFWEYPTIRTFAEKIISDIILKQLHP